MKYLLFSLLLLPSFVHGQDSLRTLSKYEKFSVPGKLYKIETKDIRKVKDITVSLVRTTEIESKKSITAIQLYQRNTSVFSSNDLGAIYIDMDDLQGVSDALKYYQTQIKGGRPQNQSYFIYSTSNGVLINCTYLEGNSPGWSVSLGHRYPSSKNTMGGSAVLKNREIDEMAQALQEAKSASF